MLSQFTAFSSFGADDIAAERAFFSDTLGLAVSEENGMLMIDLTGGGRVLIYPRTDHRPAAFTVLNFEVPDIDAAVDLLTGRGVSFERYEDLGQDERGIMRDMGPSIAWFTDPAGNILAVIEVKAP